jgi:hypothetical protein
MLCSTWKKTNANAYGEFQTKNEKNTLKLNANIDFTVMNEWNRLCGNHSNDVDSFREIE